MGKMIRAGLFFLSLACLLGTVAQAQQTLGSISGTVTDSSGGVVHNAVVKILNLATGLEQNATTKADGSFNVADLPIGAYSVTFSRDGFQTEVHSQIFVQGNRTTTVNGSLQPGAVTATVTVTATPLMNQTDTTIGYVVDQQIISRRRSAPVASRNWQFSVPAFTQTFWEAPVRTPVSEIRRFSPTETETRAIASR